MDLRNHWRVRFTSLALFSLSLVIVNIAFTNRVFADEATSAQIAELNNRPQVYVSDLHINTDGNAFKAGDTVDGTVTFYNSSSFDLFDLKYEIRLVSGIKTGIYRTYDKAAGEENIAINAGESKTVSFSYVLPKRFSGDDIGLFIQSQLADGSELGWKTSGLFNISGGVPYLSVAGSAVSVRGAQDTIAPKDYGPNVGPTIYRDKDPRVAFISFLLNNSSKVKITVVPVIEISKYRATSTLPAYRKELKESQIVVSSGETSKRVDLPLPDFGWTPGVYVGTVKFVDDMGERSERVNFRYIVGGEIFSIPSFSSDKNSVEEGDTVHISLRYFGTPYDESASEHPTSQIATVETTLFNEGDSVVSIHKEEMDFLGGGVKEFDVKASRDANALRAEVEIKKGADTVAKYNFALNADYDAIKASHRSNWFGYNAILLIILGLSMIVIGVIYMTRHKRIITRRKRS